MIMNADDLIVALKLAKIKLLNEGRLPKKKDSQPKHDKPFVIPNSWRWAKLSEVSVIQEGPGIRKHQYKDGGVQFLTVTNILDGSLDITKSEKYISEKEYLEKYQHFTINEGDIVTACSGATWGKSAIFEGVDHVMILNTSTLRLRFFDDICSNKYLYYFTKSNSFRSQLSFYQTGQQPNYGYSHYSLIHTPIASLSEQQQIVEKLDQAFEMIDQAKANIEQNIINVKELFQSKLDEVFSQKDEGWQNEKLGFIGKPTMCKRIFKDETSNVGDIPFYKIGTFGKKPDAYISKELYENYKEKYSYPKKGDVLISASGTIGRRVVFDGNPAYFQDSNIVWIDNDESIITNRYLYHFYGYCKWTTTTGATIARLYNNNLRDIDITFPTKINDQDLVVKFIDEFQENTNRLLIRYQQKLDNLEELRKSILEKAFRGELTK